MKYTLINDVYHFFLGFEENIINFEHNVYNFLRREFNLTNERLMTVNVCNSYMYKTFYIEEHGTSDMDCTMELKVGVIYYGFQ